MALLNFYFSIHVHPNIYHKVLLKNEGLLSAEIFKAFKFEIDAGSVNIAITLKG